jgi:hypothetical protein
VLSGFDKVTSSAWRNGEAVHSIIHLEYFTHPSFYILTGDTFFIVVAWFVILFELFFPVIIWFKRLRICALVVGILFHIGIIFVLNLPDFGIVMILTYSLFFPWKKEKTPAYKSNLL